MVKKTTAFKLPESLAEYRKISKRINRDTEAKEKLRDRFLRLMAPNQKTFELTSGAHSLSITTQERDQILNSKVVEIYGKAELKRKKILVVNKIKRISVKRAK